MTKEQKGKDRKNREKYKVNRRRYNKKYYARTRKYNYIRWTKEMDNMVLEHKITDTEMSDIIDKSVMAIQVRRWRLKRYGQ